MVARFKEKARPLHAWISAGAVGSAAAVAVWADVLTGHELIAAIVAGLVHGTARELINERRTVPPTDGDGVDRDLA
jgi:hypothetical protein